MCRASAPGWRSGHRPGSRQADNCRGGANRPTVGWSLAPERTPWDGRSRRVRTRAEAPEEGSFSASDACLDDRMDGLTILGCGRLTSAVNEGLVHLRVRFKNGAGTAASPGSIIKYHGVLRGRAVRTGRPRPCPRGFGGRSTAFLPCSDRLPGLIVPPSQNGYSDPSASRALPSIGPSSLSAGTGHRC